MFENAILFSVFNVQVQELNYEVPMAEVQCGWMDGWMRGRMDRWMDG